MNDFTIFFGIFLVSMLFVPPSMSTTAAQDSEIPAWIKNNAGWWATDQIDDSSFLQGIQYLIKEGIMVIPPTETSESSGSEGIPTWIKNNAGWWAEGQIHDEAFVSGIQWLVSNGIMVIEQEESVSSGPTFEIAYQTKLVSIKKPYSITLIYSTQNDACSADDKEKAKAYGIMTEYLANKNTRPNPTQVTAYCKVLHEITGNTWPLVLKELGINQPDIIVYVGGLKANFESYYDESAVGWWSCNWTYTGHAGGWQCMPNQIVICDECRVIGTFSDNAVRDRDSGDPMERGMMVLAHEFGHHNIHEITEQWEGWIKGIHDNQYAYDLCYENNILESEPCTKLYENVEVMGKTYRIMDINYVKRNWDDGIIESIMDKVESMTGINSDVEGFKKFKLIEYDVEKIDPITKKVDVTDILSIEYPDDWEQDYYKYDWSIWSTNSTDPDNIYECCHIFQADNATIRVQADLWKDDTRETGPQYYWNYLAVMTLYFLDNVHYGGATDEIRFDALEDAESKYCSNASYNKDQYICRNFKVLEKSIYNTDEGRKAYSVTTTYDLGWLHGGMTTYIGTTTELYIGEDAWQVWTEFDEDVFEYSRDEVDRFNSSLILLDTTAPIPSVPATPVTIVTEDGIQYKANKAWDEFLSNISDEEERGDLAEETKISKYDVTCGTDCNISLNEHMEVGEIITDVWDGTELEYKQWQEGGQQVWDKEKQDWVRIEVDKWVAGTIDLRKFQDKKLHDEIWDIYTSITPKQIIEQIDTFLISTDDAGGGAAHVARCIDEYWLGCGPPDTPNTKYVINFDPIDVAPTSGQTEAYLQPGKLKDALEVDMLKGTVIHENAHILSLSASQSDNDLIGYEEWCDDNECDDNKYRRIFAQREAACAPNYYDYWSGCLKEDSYLNLFFQKFWADIYREYYYGDNQIMSTDAFHAKYYDQFVSNYAADHPIEDFAESFTAFVLWDDVTIDNHKKWCKSEYDFGEIPDPPGGYNLINEQGLSYWKWCAKIYRDNSIWEEKIRFFYDFPELVEMRDFIRSNL
jgi:hypothetical protein